MLATKVLAMAVADAIRKERRDCPDGWSGFFVPVGFISIWKNHMTVQAIENDQSRKSSNAVDEIECSAAQTDAIGRLMINTNQNGIGSRSGDWRTHRRSG